MRTAQEIHKEVQRAKRLKAQWQAAIDRLQNECNHATATKIPKGNTGNYDPSADSYWCECSCPVCEKRWMEDQ